MSAGEAELEIKVILVINQCVYQEVRTLIIQMTMALRTPHINGCLCRWLHF